MALKDWEKQRDTDNLQTWTNQKLGKRNQLVEVYNNKVNSILGSDKSWVVIFMKGNDVNLKIKFKTKSEALAYARKFMSNN